MNKTCNPGTIYAAVLLQVLDYQKNSPKNGFVSAKIPALEFSFSSFLIVEYESSKFITHSTAIPQDEPSPHSIISCNFFVFFIDFEKAFAPQEKILKIQRKLVAIETDFNFLNCSVG